MFVLAIKEVWLAVQAVEKYHSRLNLTSTVQFENYKKKKISKCCHAVSLYIFFHCSLRLHGADNSSDTKLYIAYFL